MEGLGSCLPGMICFERLAEVIIMEITINGEKRDFASPMSVGELLKALGFDAQSVIVERNLEIVHRNDMTKVSVSDGDTIEIIRVVGGG